MDKLIAIIAALAFVAVIFCAWSCAGADHTATERLFIPKHQKELYDRIKPRKWVMQEFEF